MPPMERERKGTDEQTLGKILAAVAVGAAAGVSLKKVREIKARKEKERLNAIESAVVHNRNYGTRKAYIVGGGLAGLGGSRLSGAGLPFSRKADCYF